jgi:hypothetical protein
LLESLETAESFGLMCGREEDAGGREEDGDVR